MIVGVDASHFLTAKIYSIHFSFAEYIKCIFFNICDQVSKIIYSNDMAQDLLFGCLDMAICHFLKRGQGLSKGGDGNPAGKTGGRRSEDIFFREGGSDRVDRVQFHQILLSFIAHQSKQTVIDADKKMILQLQGDQCIPPVSSRIDRYNVYSPFWKVAKNGF